MIDPRSVDLFLSVAIVGLQNVSDRRVPSSALLAGVRYSHSGVALVLAFRVDYSLSRRRVRLESRGNNRRCCDAILSVKDTPIAEFEALGEKSMSIVKRYRKHLPVKDPSGPPVRL